MIPDKNNQKNIDRVFFGEGSLQDLRPFFPDSEAIFNYYAQRMAESFPSDKTVVQCECCQRHPAELRAEFEWRGVYVSARTGIVSAIGTTLTVIFMHHVFQFLMPSKHIDFSTTHGFCSTCFAQIKRRRVAANLVKQLCLGVIVLAAMILASVVVFAVLFIAAQPTKQMIVFAVIGLCLGLFCLMAGLMGQDRIVRWCLPKSLRWISKSPFELVGLTVQRN
jgi:hypothetical protein